MTLEKHFRLHVDKGQRIRPPTLSFSTLPSAVLNFCNPRQCILSLLLQHHIKQFYMSSQNHGVELCLEFNFCPPATLSISNPSASPLKLIATIHQTSSVFPDRPITILTKYSCLDTTPREDAFRKGDMHSPELAFSSTRQVDGSAKVLNLRPTKRITFHRISGDPDLAKRTEDPDTPGFTFITIPPVGKGSVQVAWELSAERLMSSLGDDSTSLQEKLEHSLRVGDTYHVCPGDLSIRWWSFGSLEDPEGLKGKKISRFSFSDDLGLDREKGADESEEVVSKMQDLIDLHNVNKLSSRSAVEGEEKPDIKKMREEGWVFGEPPGLLKMIAQDEDKVATFKIVE
jgi:hypothetical protein